MRGSRLLRSFVPSADFPNARLITLNREKALNALNTEMVDELAAIYKSPHANPHHIVIMKGAGSKAFCAGGDVVSIVKDTPPGTKSEFFYKEYQVNYHIKTMAQKQVSLWDGIVMGGGVGMSIHGAYRVASEKALFAMPETGIGLFPDVGGSWFLPRLPVKGLGLYLALTGRRLKGADLLHGGLATHYVPSANIPALEAQLCNIQHTTQVGDILSHFSAKPSEIPPFSLAKDLQLIERIFEPYVTVEDMVANLRADGSDVAVSLADGLLKCSPTALKVSHELFVRGAKITDPRDIFVMEYFATQRAMQLGDFTAGVTALLIEKTNKPVWSPPTLHEVSKELVNSHFVPATPTTATWSPDIPYASARP